MQQALELSAGGLQAVWPHVKAERCNPRLLLAPWAPEDGFTKLEPSQMTLCFSGFQKTRNRMGYFCPPPRAPFSEGVGAS